MYLYTLPVTYSLDNVICDTNRSEAYKCQLELVCMKRCFHATWLKVNADLQLTCVCVCVQVK